jgi:superfamily I DNA and/or RNA helicase
LVSIRYALGEKVEVHLKRRNNLSHRFREGSGVKFFNVLKNEQSDWNGHITQIRQDNIRIILSNDNLEVSDIPDKGSFGIELVYDERPYKLMLETIDTLLDKKILKSELINKILAEDICDEIYEPEVPFLELGKNINESQRYAVALSSAAAYLSVIHGPPGTGKTTTIVEIIRSIHKSVNKILVCAPSNTAVDLLAERINARGLKVIRLGNITRIDDKIIDLTLESLLRNHHDWAYIKKVKIEADQAEKMASRYSRSFGESERRERFELKKTSRDLRKWARELEGRLISKIVEDSKVVCTTLIGSALKDLDGIIFDLVIIDEASQALEPECWVAISKAKKVIFVGDHKQLPPTVKSQDAKKLGLEITMLDRFTEIAAHTCMLKEQYRMNSLIMNWPNHQFYDGKLTANDKVKSWTIGHLSPITFIDTAGAGFEEKVHKENLSYYNEGEYFIISEHIVQNKELLLGHEIGIISPYAEQVKYIKEQLEQDKFRQGLDIEVNTIDGFQGEEKDVIYLSLTRSNEKGLIGFVEDERRINVAMTRAKKMLVIIGDSSTLGQHTLYIDLLDYIERHGVYSSAWEYMST